MAKRRIKDLTTTATAADLKSGNFLPLDGAEGTKKVPAELLKVPTTLAALSDDSEHRLVTDDEKTAWDGKQDAMSVAADSTTAFDNATTIMVAKSGSNLRTRTALSLYNYIKGKLDAVYATASSLTGHTSDTSNPHRVTKAQVGLGSVDNTSDADKPVSTATQTALDGKANKNTYSVANYVSSDSSLKKLAYYVGYLPEVPYTQMRIRYFAHTGSGTSRQGTLYVECGASGYNVRDVVENITGDGLSGLKFQYAHTTPSGGPRMTIYALLGVDASLSYCIESEAPSAWTIANSTSTDTGLTDAIVEFDTPTTREIDGSVVSANQLEESGIYIVKNATQANYMTNYSKLLILVHKESDTAIYQHCFSKGYTMNYIGARAKNGSSWYPSWEKLQMEADISGNAATATNATNADKVDGKHLQVLASVPDDYDTDSVYLIYGSN